MSIPTGSFQKFHQVYFTLFQQHGDSPDTALSLFGSSGHHFWLSDSTVPFLYFGCFALPYICYCLGIYRPTSPGSCFGFYRQPYLCSCFGSYLNFFIALVFLPILASKASNLVLLCKISDFLFCFFLFANKRNNEKESIKNINKDNIYIKSL